MPRRSARPALADLNPAEGGVATLDRALSVLGAFSAAKPTRTLAEIAGVTRIGKSTVLRMLASLGHAHLVQKLPDGSYALGTEVERLHKAYSASVSTETQVMPILRALVGKTRESAAYYVRQGEHRLCLHRVDSPRAIRDFIRVGDLLPLDRGAGGRVMLAYSGGRGPTYARIRREQVAVFSGDRVAEVAGVGAPVFGADGALAGVLTLTMPAERLRPEFAQPVLRAAKTLTERFGGVFPAPD